MRPHPVGSATPSLENPDRWRVQHHANLVLQLVIGQEFRRGRVVGQDTLDGSSPRSRAVTVSRNRYSTSPSVDS